MNDKTISAIALLLVIIGILTLLLLDFTTAQKTIPITEAKKQLNAEVSIKAKVLSIQDTPTVMILTVKDDTDKIRVIMFKSTWINMKKGITLLITGKIQKYKDEMELLAKEITYV